MQPARRGVALPLAVACCMIAALTACVGDEDAVPTASESAAPATTAAAPPTTAAAPSAEAAPLTPEELDLCVDRSVDPPATFFLSAGSTSLDHLRAAVADVRRSRLSAAPERVARLSLDATVPSLTVVPAAGEEASREALSAAFSALAGIDVDLETALASVEIVAPEGRPFSEQCAAYGEAWALMQSNPDDGPTLVGLGFDLERGVITIGVTDPEHPRFAALGAHGPVVEISEELCCDVGE